MDSSDPAVGMSDEEELRRIGADIQGAEGLGETIVDFDEFYGEDALLDGTGTPAI